MRRQLSLIAALILCVGVSPANAGWVIEQTSTFTNSKGAANSAEPSTVRISQGRTRISQASAISMQDCVKEKMAIWVPDRNVYWSGSFKDYLAESRAAQAKLAQGPAQKKDGKPKPIDESKLPKIEIKKTEETATIGGYPTTKYIILSNGVRFQEIWLTTAVNLTDDRNPTAYLACQAKLSDGMRGASADDFAALHRSADYAAFLGSGVPMKTIVYHLAGNYLTEVRSVSRADVPDSDFVLPAGAENVAVDELFGDPANAAK